MKFLDEKLKKWITSRTLAVFFIIVYGLSLIPMLWIGWYNYPSADDYTNGSACHLAIAAGESIFGVIDAVCDRVIYEWINWRGCFTASFLSSIVPSAFGERGYVLTIWLMLGILTFSTAYLLQVIFVKVFKADMALSLCVSFSMLFITVQCMVGKVEMFYWYSGAVNYTFLHGMSLIFLALLIDAVYKEGKKRSLTLAIASVMGFLVGGGNQMTPLNVAIVLVSSMLIIIWKKKWKAYKAWLIPMISFFAGFGLNLIAPGNYVRASVASGMNPIKAVFVSFYYCLDIVLGEWTTWPVLLLIVLLVLFFWKMTRHSSFDFAFPGIVVLFGFCVVSAMFTPALFAIGNVAAPRIQGLTFTMYILVLTLCVGYVTGWVRKKWDARNAADREADTVSFKTEEIWFLAGTVAVFCIAAVITVIPTPRYFTASSAITDLRNGSAQAYGEAMEERIEAYRSGEKNVEVAALPAYPELLYFSDIKMNADDWENQGVCRFYELDSVKISQ